MAFRSSIPNIIEPITDGRGRISKAWWDFFLNLWEKVGGESTDVPGIEEGDFRRFIDDKSAVAASRKRIEDLESSQHIPDSRSLVSLQRKRINDLEAQLASLSKSFRQGRRPLLQTLDIDVPSRAVYVDINGSDDTGDGTQLNPFATIEQGITFAKTVTAFDISVVVGQGTYTINNPFEVPNNIFLIGWDTNGFFPTPQNTAADLFTIGTTDPDAEVVFINMRINGGGALTSMVKQEGVDSRVFALNCSMRNAAGIGWDCRAGFMSLDTVESSELDSNGTVYKASGTGSLSIGRNTAIDSTITTVFLCDGASASLDVFGPTIIDEGAATVTTAIQIDNSGSSNFQSALIRGPTTGLDVNNGSTVDLVAVLFEQTTTAINVNDLNSVVRFVGSKLDKNQLSFPDGYDNFNMLFQDDTEGEESTKVFGDFYVGRPESGTESCLGRGEPVTRGMKVITTDSTATGTTEGGNLTDVSSNAASFSGSTFTFQGTAANHTILIGLDLSNGVDKLTHAGLFIKQTTAAVEVTPRSFIFEYWDGAAWSEITVMSIQDENSFRYGNEVFIRANNNEHVRFNHDIQSGWTKKTISGDNLFWSRIRIVTAVTTSPVFEQFRLHSEFAEFSQEGIQRFYGRSRYRETLLAAGNVYSETGGIGNANLAIGSGGIPTGWTHRMNNQQMNGPGDAIYMQFVLPRGICTANPLNIVFYYIPEQAGASTDASVIISVLPIEVQGTIEADPAGGVTSIARTLANTETVTTNTAQATTVSTPIVDNTKLQQISSDPVDISDYYEGDMIFVRVELDATGSANKDIFVVSVEVNGVSWTPGERLS